MAVEQPDILTRVQRFNAMRHAAFAARRRLPATVCPYYPHSEDTTQRVLARVWVAEYLRVIQHADQPAAHQQ